MTFLNILIFSNQPNSKQVKNSNEVDELLNFIKAKTSRWTRKCGSLKI